MTTNAPEKIWAATPADGLMKPETMYGWTTEEHVEEWRLDSQDDIGPDSVGPLAYVEYIRADLIAGVKVKPLEWELRANKEGVVYCAYDPLYGREVEAPNERTCDAIDQDRTARILAALEAAPHVNETPKTEHDGA